MKREKAVIGSDQPRSDVASEKVLPLQQQLDRLQHLFDRLTPRALSSVLSPVGSAAPRMCMECPWRVTNRDRVQPDGWYDDSVRQDYWRSLQAGSPLVTCHMTEPLYEPSAAAIEAGYRTTPENAAHRECTGALLLLLREANQVEAAGSYEAYKTARGDAALPAGVLEDFAARRRGETRPAVADLAADPAHCPPLWLPTLGQVDPG